MFHTSPIQNSSPILFPGTYMAALSFPLHCLKQSIQKDSNDSLKPLIERLCLFDHLYFFNSYIPVVYIVNHIALTLIIKGNTIVFFKFTWFGLPIGKFYWQYS